MADEKPTGINDILMDNGSSGLQSDVPGASAARAASTSSEKNQVTSTKTGEYKINDDPNYGRKSKSELTILSFPQGLGGDNTEKMPYILFKIFETQQGNVEITDPTSASLRGGADVFGDFLNNDPMLIGAVLGGAAYGARGAIAGAAAGTEAGQKAIDSLAKQTLGMSATNFTSKAKELVKNFALKRNTEQLGLAIALFMPEGLNTNYDNEYDTLSVTSTLGAVGFAAQALSSKDGQSADISPYIMEAASKVAGRVLGNEEVGKLGLFATTGLVQNPQMETIYSTPRLRTFTFEFRMIPKNAIDSLTIRDIVKNFKYHSAPQIKDGTGGRFLVPPAQFEVEFYDGNNNENLYFFKTKKCVLTGISIDYAPNGYATFRDGAPVETRMQLTFQETVIIDRKAVQDGF